MSWWVYLVGDEGPEDDRWPVPVTKHREGGTYDANGAERAELNITYNYSPLFRSAWDGVGLEEMLHGKTAAETIPALKRAIEKLGVERSENYWDDEPGNAGYALSILLEWAAQHSTAQWEVS